MSSIDTSVPAQGALIASSDIRNNFEYAANDIEDLESRVGQLEGQIASSGVVTLWTGLSPNGNFQIPSHIRHYSNYGRTDITQRSLPLIFSGMSLVDDDFNYQGRFENVGFIVTLRWVNQSYYSPFDVMPYTYNTYSKSFYTQGTGGYQLDNRILQVTHGQWDEISFDGARAYSSDPRRRVYITSVIALGRAQ